jgi:MATH domain
MAMCTISQLGSYTWRVDKWSSKANKTGSIFSPSFTVCGLQWHLVVYPQGLESGAGTHLSLFLACDDSDDEEEEDEEEDGFEDEEEEEETRKLLHGVSLSLVMRAPYDEEEECLYSTASAEDFSAGAQWCVKSTHPLCIAIIDTSVHFVQGLEQRFRPE